MPVITVEVDSRYCAPVGSLVSVRAEELQVEGARVASAIEAADELEVIGSGRHERVVVEEARFLRRVHTKREMISEKGMQRQEAGTSTENVDRK